MGRVHIQLQRKDLAPCLHHWVLEVARWQATVLHCFSQLHRHRRAGFKRILDSLVWHLDFEVVSAPHEIMLAMPSDPKQIVIHALSLETKGGAQVPLVVPAWCAWCRA